MSQALSVREVKKREVNDRAAWDVAFDGTDYEWTATIAFADKEGQLPVEMGIYIWKLGDPRTWEVRMEDSLELLLGYPVVVENCGAGNGHGSARLRRVEKRVVRETGKAIQT